MKHSQKLQGLAAIVTGGARGIGRATAIALAQEGADVAILDLDAEDSAAVRETREAIAGTGRQCIYYRADVTNLSQVESAISGAAEVFGKINILVNNAGKGRDPVPI